MRETANSVASHIETAVANYLGRYYPEAELFRFSPSIVNGRRFCGLKTKDGKEFLITLLVEEA